MIYSYKHSGVFKPRGIPQKPNGCTRWAQQQFVTLQVTNDCTVCICVSLFKVCVLAFFLLMPSLHLDWISPIWLSWVLIKLPWPASSWCKTQQLDSWPMPREISTSPQYWNLSTGCQLNSGFNLSYSFFLMHYPPPTSSTALNTPFIWSIIISSSYSSL